jgi:hypothetical protein
LQKVHKLPYFYHAEAAIASQISIEAVAVVIWKPDSRSDSFDEKYLASIWPLSISSFVNEMSA